MYDINDLWDSAQALNIELLIVTDIANRLYGSVVKNIIGSKCITSCKSSDCDWTANPSHGAQMSAKSISDAILSLFEFLKTHVRPLTELGRRVWVKALPDLVRTFGYSDTLSQFESAMIDRQFIPPDVPRRLASGWEEMKSHDERGRIAAILDEVRNHLLNDKNRLPVHLKPLSTLNAPKAYIPRTISGEAARLVQKYFADDAADCISEIISLFISLRQPETCDPKAIDARQAGIFFNDCVYLSLVLSLRNQNHQSEILLLRAAAGQSMSWFIRMTADRALNLLKFNGGLLQPDQIADGERAMNASLKELTECIKQWIALHITDELVQLWTTTLVDPLVRHMTRICVESARIALAKGSKPGLLYSSSTVVTSGVWSLQRSFMQRIEEILPLPILGRLVNWTVACRVRTALTSAQVDIMHMDPLPADEVLYGVTAESFEALLHCNPLLQGESKDSFQKLTSRIMSQSADNQYNLIAPVDHHKPGNEKNFAALFDRA